MISSIYIGLKVEKLTSKEMIFKNNISKYSIHVEAGNEMGLIQEVVQCSADAVLEIDQSFPIGCSVSGSRLSCGPI